MSPNVLKQRVAEVALATIESTLTPDTVLGIGTGSTVNCFIDCLARSKIPVLGTVSSSEATTQRLTNHGIHVFPLNEVSEVAIYVDGADEVDSNFALIKGGGGALTREKIVASIAQKFVCIVDEGKVVGCLGKFPVPVEVLEIASSAVARKLRDLGGSPQLRSGLTDNDNRILDVSGLRLEDPDYWEQTINDIPGVVTAGIFSFHRPQELLIANPDGTVDHKVRA